MSWLISDSSLLRQAGGSWVWGGTRCTSCPLVRCMRNFEDEASATLQSCLVNCVDDPVMEAYSAASEGAARMTARHGAGGLVVLEVLLAARVGGLWRRFCGSRPSRETVGGLLGIGVAHTSLTRSLLDAQVSLLSIFAGYIPSDSTSAALRSFDAVVEQFVVEQPLHGREVLFSQHLLLAAVLVHLGAVQHGLTAQEFLRVDLRNAARE